MWHIKGSYRSSDTNYEHSLYELIFLAVTSRETKFYYSPYLIISDFCNYSFHFCAYLLTHMSCEQ